VHGDTGEGSEERHQALPRGGALRLHHVTPAVSADSSSLNGDVPSIRYAVDSHGIAVTASPYAKERRP